MKAFGTQLIAEFLDCQQAALLAHGDQMEALLKEGIPYCGLDLRQIAVHQFDPMGVTAVAIIGESHVALHTYPETQHVAVDIFTCAPGAAGPTLLLDWLKARLQPREVRTAELLRGHKIAFQQPGLITDFSKAAFEISYHVRATYLHERSAWQEIKVIDNPTFGRMLFLDQELQIAESDAIYHQTLVGPLQPYAPARVAILGGGDGGTLHCLLQQIPALKEVAVLEIDPAVVAVAQVHLQPLCGDAFEDPRTALCYGDACALLANFADLDAVIGDLTTAPEIHSHQAWDVYAERLVGAMAQALRPGGMVSLQVGSAFEQARHIQLTALLQRHFEAVRCEAVFIPSFCERWMFLTARKL
jgi:spermidine synthase